jgi:hypothetical protein
LSSFLDSGLRRRKGAFVNDLARAVEDVINRFSGNSRILPLPVDRGSRFGIEID